VAISLISKTSKAILSANVALDAKIIKSVVDIEVMKFLRVTNETNQAKVTKQTNNCRVMSNIDGVVEVKVIEEGVCIVATLTQ